MKRRRLAVNLLSNLLSYAVSTALSFVITPFLVNHLGKEIYGFYGIANNFVNYITIVSVALNSMASKYITVELVRGNEQKAKEYYSSIFFSNVILCLILTPVLVLLVFNLQLVLNISDNYLHNVQILFALIFGAMLIRFVSSIYGCATYASNRMDLRAYTEMIKSVLRLILYVLIFTVFKPSIVYVGIVFFLLELFNSITQIYLARKLLPNMYIRRSFCNVKLIADTLKVGVWNSLNQLGDLLLSSSDLIMSNVLLGESASGSISIVKTMPTLISGVITAVNGVFMPRISHRYGENNKEALIKEVQMSQKIMGAMVTPIIILLIVFGYDFFDLWVPGNDTKLLMQLSALDVSRMLIIGVAWPVSNLNIVLDKVKIPSLIVLASGGLNIISMIILTKHTSMGIYAILLTTLFIAVLFYGLIIPIYPCRLLEISVLSFYKPIFQMFLASGLIFVCIFPLYRLFEITNWFDFFVCGGLCSIIAYLISLLIFIGPKQAYAKIRRQ